MPEGGAAQGAVGSAELPTITVEPAKPKQSTHKKAAKRPSAPSAGPVQVAQGESSGTEPAGATTGWGPGGEADSSTSYIVPYTATATKFDLSPRETPQTVVVTTQKVIQDFNLTDVKDILQFTPGVYVENERNVGAFQYFSRGYELQIQFDGVPSAIRIGDRDAIALDSAMLDRVEVLQGAAGLLTGAGAPGGTINLIRKMPTKKFEGSLEATAGPWEGGRLAADMSTPLSYNGKLRARVVGVLTHNDSFIDYVYNDVGFFYGVIQADLTRSTLLTAGVNLESLDGSNGAAYGNPTAHDGGDLGLPRSLNLGADWASEKRQTSNAFVKLDQQLGREWLLQGQVMKYTASADFLESSTYYSVDPETGLGAGIWGALESWDTDSTAADLFLTGPVKLFGQKHQLMAGMNGYRNNLWSLGYTETIDALQWINVYDHHPKFVPWPNSLPFAKYGPDSETQTTQYGTFAGTRINPTDFLHVILGGRLTWYKADIYDVQVLKEEDVFTPYSGVVLDLTRWMSVYGSYTDIFRPNDPSLKDVSGNVLAPEIGENYEVGIKADFFRKRLNTSFALFRINHSNLAELDLFAEPFSCNGADCYRATGLVITEGVDLGIAGEVSPGWNLYGGYTFINQEYANGVDEGERFRPQTPANLFKLATTYEIPNSRWTVGANFQYRGGIYAEGEENWFIPDTPWRIEQDGVFLVGLMTKYRLTPSAYLLATVDNLFDEKYYSGISVPYHGSVYGDPRKATLTLRKTF